MAGDPGASSVAPPEMCQVEMPSRWNQLCFYRLRQNGVCWLWNKGYSETVLFLTFFSGPWCCQCCQGKRVKTETDLAPTQSLAAQISPAEINNSTIDVSFFSSLAPPSLSTVITNMNSHAPRHQCPGGALVNAREMCGVCNLGGDLVSCPQCRQCFHTNCHFSRGTAICRSCSRTFNSSKDREAQPSPLQTSCLAEPLLHNNDLDTIMGEQGSMDGILQWTIHDIFRPLTSTQGYL